MLSKSENETKGEDEKSGIEGKLKFKLKFKCFSDNDKIEVKDKINDENANDLPSKGHKESIVFYIFISSGW